MLHIPILPWFLPWFPHVSIMLRYDSPENPTARSRRPRRSAPRTTLPWMPWERSSLVSPAVDAYGRMGVRPIFGFHRQNIENCGNSKKRSVIDAYWCFNSSTLWWGLRNRKWVGVSSSEGNPKSWLWNIMNVSWDILRGKPVVKRGAQCFISSHWGGMWVKCWGPSQERIDLLQPIIFYQSCWVKQQYRWYFSVSVMCKKTGNALKIIGELANICQERDGCIWIYTNLHLEFELFLSMAKQSTHGVQLRSASGGVIGWFAPSIDGFRCQERLVICQSRMVPHNIH